MNQRPILITVLVIQAVLLFLEQHATYVAHKQTFEAIKVGQRCVDVLREETDTFNDFIAAVQKQR